jgi:imidazolonepropionase-like amidohydrolase
MNGKITACALALALGLAFPALAQTVAIQGGTVHTMTGPPIPNGTVLIRDGRIEAVGQNVTVPGNATRIDATGKVVMPGLIDAMTYYGIEPADLNETPNPITPELRIIEAYYPFGTFGAGEAGALRAEELLRGGVTTIYIAPADKTVLGGQGAVVKTAGPDFASLVVLEPAAIDMTLGSHPTKTYRDRQQSPSTRLAVVSRLRETFIKAQEYQARVDAAGSDAERPPRNLGMEALGKLLSGELPARIQANAPGDIQTALNLADEFGFEVTIDGGATAHQMRDELARRGVPVIVGPISHPYVAGEEIPDEGEYPDVDERNIVWLDQAGVKVALGSFSFGLGSLAKGVTGQWLLVDAAIAAGHGMSDDAVLRAVTRNPAEILGVDDRVGTIEPGKDGDVIVLDGDPLSVRTWAEMVFVGGALVYERERGWRGCSWEGSWCTRGNVRGCEDGRG